MRVRGALWLPGGIVDGLVTFDERGVVVEVRPARSTDPPPVDGLLLPGLINAHTHLEFSNHRGRVPSTAEGFLPWLRMVLSQKDLDDRELAGRRGAVEMVEAGTAWAWDVCNQGDSGPWMQDARLGGVVQHEVLGFDKAQLPGLVAALGEMVDTSAPPWRRPSPHALFSTAPELVKAAVDACRSVPATIHVGEAEGEALFVAEGRGPHGELLDAIGRDWRWWTAEGRTPLELLDSLGVLGPQLLLVHGVRLSEADIALAASRRAPLCVCPRSNLHIGGELPDLPSWMAAGVALAVGTDSLASTPDLDLFGELHVLATGFPEVPPERWLSMATHEGAGVVDAPVGRIEVGLKPGLLQVGMKSARDLRAGPPDRQWLVAP